MGHQWTFSPQPLNPCLPFYLSPRLNCTGRREKGAGTWLVDWLRVPTPMRAIRVRAWVEVVGFVMELFHCRVQWNAIYLWRHLAVRGRTRKYLALQYTKILQSSTKSRIRPRTMGKMGQTNHEAMRKGKHWQALRQGDESLCNLLERPIQWAGERKTPWGKPGERYKHRWGKVRQASRWGPWKFRPSTAYGAFPPHTQWFITSSWPLGG